MDVSRRGAALRRGGRRVERASGREDTRPLGGHPRQARTPRHARSRPPARLGDEAQPARAPDRAQPGARLGESGDPGGRPAVREPRPGAGPVLGRRSQRWRRAHRHRGRHSARGGEAAGRYAGMVAGDAAAASRAAWCRQCQLGRSPAECSHARRRPDDHPPRRPAALHAGGDQAACRSNAGRQRRSGFRPCNRTGRRVP